MQRRAKGSGFKMRRSPVKGVYDPITDPENIMQTPTSSQQLIEAAQQFVRPVEQLDLDYGGEMDVRIPVNIPDVTTEVKSKRQKEEVIAEEEDTRIEEEGGEGGDAKAKRKAERKIKREKIKDKIIDFLEGFKHKGGDITGRPEKKAQPKKKGKPSEGPGIVPLDIPDTSESTDEDVGGDWLDADIESLMPPEEEIDDIPKPFVPPKEEIELVTMPIINPQLAQKIEPDPSLALPGKYKDERKHPQLETDVTVADEDPELNNPQLAVEGQFGFGSDQQWSDDPDENYRYETRTVNGKTMSGWTYKGRPISQSKVPIGHQVINQEALEKDYKGFRKPKQESRNWPGSRKNQEIQKIKRQKQEEKDRITQERQEKKNRIARERQEKKDIIAREKEEKIEQKKSEQYSDKSLDELSNERDEMKESNEDTEGIQEEINKRMEDPNVDWSDKPEGEVIEKSQKSSPPAHLRKKYEKANAWQKRQIEKKNRRYQF